MRNSFFIILVVALIIALFGILSIYSSTYQKEGDVWKDIYKRQVLWLAIGLACYFVFSNLSYRYLWDWAHIIYAFTIFFLLLVVVMGAVRLGAQRWLRIAWFNFQPSEFVKLAMAISLARYYSKKDASDIRVASGSMGILRSLALPLLLVAIPVGLIIEQPDLGSGLIIIFLFIAVIYTAGVKLRYLFILLGSGLLIMPFFWNFLKDYQKERLLVFLNPNMDPLGAGYTVIQSKIAVGSSGIFGKGWLAGTQSQLHFLPEAHTDFIFATFTEEWGFLGSVVLLSLYYILIRRGFMIAGRTQDNFGKFLALGITLVLGIQIFINIAMNLGLAPIVGLPLPLMSYGGSSMFVTFTALGILVNIDKRRAVF
ncbi:MAG: rod shape-determining protein RodA [Candidatus Omnitrophica bacterium]|nr:rod shape-determining protein RodA [Candidatus Omnitrophota bacterium]